MALCLSHTSPTKVGPEQCGGILENLDFPKLKQQE